MSIFVGLDRFSFGFDRHNYKLRTPPELSFCISKRVIPDIANTPAAMAFDDESASHEATRTIETMMRIKLKVFIAFGYKVFNSSYNRSA